MAYHFAKSGGLTNEAYDCDRCKESRLHLGRNCNRFFKDQPRIPHYKWMPDYRTAKGNPVPVIEGVECDECPISFIHGFKNGQSMRWLEFRSRIIRLNECGVQVFGPGEISSKEADILLTIQNAENAQRNAVFEAEQAERELARHDA